ncbi:replication restart DNA helicase PriA [bacterium A37T11]|nr:replication restart DNA helicase PriA [bacterium A37T11]
MLELQHPDEREGRITLFVDVVLPLAISKTYSYRVPYELSQQVGIGRRVVVQFGKSRIYTAIILHISQKAPERYEAKYLLDVLDDQPIVREKQLELWEWMSAYYLCTIGEVMNAALPAALKLASETTISANTDPGQGRDELNDKEYLIMDALDISPVLKISDIVKLLGQKTVFPIIKRLFEKGFIQISEELAEKYKPRVRAFIVLNSQFKDPETLPALFEELNKAPKQLDALLAYIQLSRKKLLISKAELLEVSGCGSSALKALVDKEIFLTEEREVSRLAGEEVFLEAAFELSHAQQKALDLIDVAFKEKPVLLHGVTASGKTQLYIRLIEKAMQQNQTVLYLLPEIGLTTQIIARLRLHFGKQVGVYHSRFNDNERAEVWQKMLNGEYKVVVGARSAVFLPFSELGLIIVDEEHETSYKQYDPAPRYHARDTAVYLGQLHGAQVLLGSATPSLESYYNARAGKYGLVTITERFGKAQLPSMQVVSLAEERQKNQVQSYFTGKLLEEVGKALEKKEQVILFQNRRGFTPMLLCRTCGYTPKCIRCDVSLTYHKSTNKLHCHYCGFKEDVITVCPACGSTQIENKGFGTERIEEELSMLLPNARIGRLDLDSTRGKHGFERILADFDEHRLDILVGTQMVAKGLDFGNVSVIGIINADTLINYPDFRAFERAYALLAQVGGRAGRRDTAGKVIIQAYATEHRILKQVLAHDYDDMFMTEVTERKTYKYPPFYRIIKIEVKHKEQSAAFDAANRLALQLRQLLLTDILGPETPLISRVRNYYLHSIMLKIARTGISIAKVKEIVQQAITDFHTNKANKGTIVQVDVDPL